MSDDTLNGLMNEVERMRDRDRERTKTVTHLKEIIATFAVAAAGMIGVHPLRDMSDILSDGDLPEIDQALATLSLIHALAHARDIADDLDGESPPWIKKAASRVGLDNVRTDHVGQSLNTLLRIAMEARARE